MTEINKGDTVRLSVEGVVDSVGYDFVSINGKSWFAEKYKVEILKKVGPVWTDGDVVLEDGFNFIWTRNRGEWFRPGGNYPVSDKTITNAFASDTRITILRQQVTK